MKRTLLALVATLHGCGGCGDPPTEAGRQVDGGLGLVFDFAGELVEGAPSPWLVKVVDGQPDFSIVPIPERGDVRHVELRSDRASFSLNRRVDLPLAADGLRFATWSWRAETLPQGKAADARVGSKCDQGLQVLFAFDGGSQVLSYVWDTNAPVGTETSEGFGALGLGKTVKVAVVQSGAECVGQWSTITRDLVADYQRRFGAAPERLSLIRVQSNSQYTGTRAAGRISPISLGDQGPATTGAPSCE